MARRNQLPRTIQQWADDWAGQVSQCFEYKAKGDYDVGCVTTKAIVMFLM